MTDSTAPTPFSIPLFRRIWIANVTSQFGSLIQSVGAAWIMVQLGGTKTQIALVSASVTLPILFLALLAGALADNYPRRLVMLTAQIVMFTASVFLCLMAWLNVLTPWMLLSFTFMIGCGTALNSPAWQATVGDIVPRKTIASAVAMNSMGFNIARSAGPALGGMIVAIAGAATAFTINVFTYIGLIFVLLRWHPDEGTKPNMKQGLGSSMMAGVRYAVMSPPVRVVLLRGILFGIAASAVLSLLPLVAHDLIKGGAATFGLLSGGFGVGAVIGALSNRYLRDHFSGEHIIRLSVLALICGGLIVSQSHILAVTIGGLILMGSGWLITVATMNITVQMSVPRWVVGRALSLFQMAIFGSMSFGSWLSGHLAETHGTANAILIMAGIQTIGLLAGFILSLPQVEDMNLDPVGRWQVPAIGLDITPRSGPIHVTVRYQIRLADIPAFIAVMDTRRQIRLRDGARNWTLSRDLQDPDLWVEHYRFGCWRDYILHNERQTHADHSSLDKLKSLHQGSWPPEIHRTLERPANSHFIDPALTADTNIDPTRPS